MVDALTDIDLAKGAAPRPSPGKTLPHPDAGQRGGGGQPRQRLSGGGNYQKSIAILDPYAREHGEQRLAWSLLSDAYRKAGRMTDLHMARAETLSCVGTTRRPSTS